MVGRFRFFRSVSVFGFLVGFFSVGSVFGFGFLKTAVSVRFSVFFIVIAACLFAAWE